VTIAERFVVRRAHETQRAAGLGGQLAHRALSLSKDA
jgi:hypothetical protein